jgi:hypothetical protein
VTITDIDPTELVPDVRAAEILHQTAGTLATWRSQRRGPAFVKLGRRVFYRRDDLHAYIAEQRRDPAAA